MTVQQKNAVRPAGIFFAIWLLLVLALADLSAAARIPVRYSDPKKSSSPANSGVLACAR
jgi:hypothetical protein